MKGEQRRKDEGESQRKEGIKIKQTCHPGDNQEGTKGARGSGDGRLADRYEVRMADRHASLPA